LNALHNSVQKNHPDKIIRLPKQKPQFEYGSGKEAQLPFRPKIEKDDVFDSDNEVDLPSPSALFGRQQESPGPFETSSIPYQDENDISLFLDNSLESLEAGMIGLSDSMMPRGLTPRVDSSFADGVFGFNKYQNNGQLQAEDTTMTENESLVEGPADLPEAKRYLKREPSPSLDESEVKHRRISRSELVQERSQAPSVPAWVDEFDPELIEGLEGIVDFVD